MAPIKLALAIVVGCCCWRIRLLCWLLDTTVDREMLGTVAVVIVVGGAEVVVVVAASVGGTPVAWALISPRGAPNEMGERALLVTWTGVRVIVGGLLRGFVVLLEEAVVGLSVAGGVALVLVAMTANLVGAGVLLFIWASVGVVLAKSCVFGAAVVLVVVVVVVLVVVVLELADCGAACWLIVGVAICWPLGGLRSCVELDELVWRTVSGLARSSDGTVAVLVGLDSRSSSKLVRLSCM